MMSCEDRRGVIYFFSLFFLFLLSFSAHAELQEGEIIEGETFSVTDGGSISIFDYDLLFEVDSNQTRLFIDDRNSDEYSIIPMDSCGTIEFLQFCFDRMSGSNIFSRIFTENPFVTLSGELGDDDVLVGKENYLELNVSNLGNLRSNETSLELSFPEGLELIDSSHGEIQGNDLSWEGEVPGQSDVTIEVDFIHREVMDSEIIEIDLVYDNYFEVMSESIETEISSYRKYDLNYSTEPEDVFLGTPFDLNIRLENINDADGGTNMTFRRFSLPLDGLPGLSSYSGFVTRTSNSLFWSGRVNYDNYREFIVSIDPSESGTLKIPVEISFNDTSISKPRVKEIKEDIPIEVISRDLGLDVSIDDQYNSSEWQEFSMNLENLDSSIEFRNITIDIEAPGNTETIDLGTLYPDSEEPLSGISFLPSPTDSQKDEEISIKVSYKNDFGEEKTMENSYSFTTLPVMEAEKYHEIEEIEEGEAFKINTYVNNTAEVDMEDIEVTHSIHERIFYTGTLTGNVSTLGPGESSQVLSYEISSAGLNFSADDYMLDSQLTFSVGDEEKGIVDEVSISEMVFSLYDDPSVLERTQETIERYFTSTNVFIMFVSALLLVVLSASTLVMYKKKFTISGYDKLKLKQKWIEQRLHKYSVREDKLKRSKQVLDGRIRDLKSFMDKTKRILEKEVPIIDEKRDGLKLRQDELKKEKELIDQKIAELKEIEKRLIKKSYAYQRELRELDNKEKDLKDRFEKVKSRLSFLTAEMNKILQKENKLSAEKERLNKKELGVVAEKQRIIKMGTEKFSAEKMDVIQEKVKLEHEKNMLEEELNSLGSRKDDITKAQDSIHKQKADLAKDKNIFDMNKEAVENSLKTLQSQSDRIKGILEESRHSYIEPSASTSDKSSKKKRKRGKKKGSARKTKEKNN